MSQGESHCQIFCTEQSKMCLLSLVVGGIGMCGRRKPLVLHLAMNDRLAGKLNILDLGGIESLVI